MKTKEYYDSLPADTNHGFRLPKELKDDFNSIFYRHGEASRVIRDFITDYTIEHLKNKETK